MAARKRTTRRRTVRRAAGFLPRGVMGDVVAVSGGQLAATMLAPKLPGDYFKTIQGQLVGRALIGVGGYMLLKRTGGASFAKQFMAGAVASAIVPYLQTMLAKGGFSGMGEFEHGAPAGIDYEGVGALPAGESYAGGDYGGVGSLPGEVDMSEYE